MFMWCIYRPPKQNKQYFPENVSSIAHHSSSIYENYILLESFNLFNLIKTNTYFKGKGSCIDLIVTNKKYCFKHSSSFETGLSDHHHHHLVYSMLKACFKREESKHFIYRDYQNFIDINFRMHLENKLE